MRPINNKTIQYNGQAEQVILKDRKPDSKE